MSVMTEFRQDKSNFIIWFSLYAMISFLAVCVLFGVYIWKSFNNQVYMAQDATGDYNIQEMNK